MLNTSQKYLSSVDSFKRNIIARVYFNGSNTPLIKDVISTKVNELGQSGDNISIGDLCTNSATVKFYMPTESIPLENGYLKIEYGVLVDSGYEYVSMGTYYISEIETVEGTNIYTVKGFDRSTRFNKDYVPTITLPTTVELVIKDVCNQCNVSIDESFVFPTINVNSLYAGTCKQTICWMAGLMGKNAKINRSDKLTFYWYKNSGYQVTRSIQYMGGFKKTTEEDITINSLTSGSEDNVLVSGNGRGISFDNPYMTQAILNNILANIKGFTYTPSITIYRGNPALEIGDVVSVEDRQGNLKSCIIGEHEISYSGGMKATITTKGKTEMEVAISKSPTEIKLKKMYNVMQNAFKESTDKIIGAKGGHYVIDYDSNGYPIGWRIMDTPSLTSNTKMWIFNKNGLGFSDDGGVTVTNFAFDLDGYLNANVIRTGALQGAYFELDLEKGTLVMGERGEDGEFITKWLEVNEYGLSMGTSAYVTTVIESSNGFTISENVYSTELTARIYDGSTEIDAEGSMEYTWYISSDGNTYEHLGTGKTISVSTSQIENNTKIYFEAE